MSVQVVQEVCYLEESTSNRDIPPGFLVKDVDSTPKPGRLAGWLGGQRAAKRIVYKERCRLHWNDLELVSFLPGGGMLGYWCRCELFVQVTEPEQLLDELGTEEPDGRWTVSLDALGAWFREPIAAALETLGAKGDLCSEAYWPTVAKQVPGRLRCPRGVMLDQREEQQTNAFIFHKILTFEQYLSALELYIWFLERLRQLGYDRQLVRIQLATEHGGDEVAEKVLNEVGEDNLAILITPEERKQPATKRLSNYIELAGSAADSELRPGVSFGRYELLTPLGQGGQGQVWKAWDSTAELFVVLKLVPRELHNATEEMNRLRSTFHIIQRLHHSNICPVLLLDRDPRFGWYQVMQYIDGQTLSTYRATYTARYGSFPLDQVVKVLRPVAEALDYAHRQNVIHRDIKPANIMVSGEAEDVQLVDFGLAAAIRTSLSTVSGQRMDTSGARPYMAPEQWRGEHQDQATDQYGLAVVAHELLDGQPPFDSPDFDILSDCVQNHVPPAIGDQPEAVNRVLVQGLAKKRRERYPNCVAFIDALAACLESAREMQPIKAQQQEPAAEPPVPETPPVILPGTPDSSPETQAPNRFVQIVLTIAILMLLVTGLLLFLPGVEEPSMVHRDDQPPSSGVSPPEVPANVGRDPEPEPMPDEPAEEPAPDLAPPPEPEPAPKPEPKPASKAEPRPDSDRGVQPPQAVAPFDAVQARQHQTAWADYLNIPIEITNSIDMPMVLVPPGEFLMGSPETEEGRLTIEGPQRRVRITRPFYVGKYPVTLGQFRAFIEATDFDAGRSRNVSTVSPQEKSHPVVHVNWDDVISFCEWLSKQEEEAYRLLTEAEWEYVCRAGTTTSYYFGDSAASLGDYAWYSENSGHKARPVGQKKPNAWRLYDMHGLVWEWCSDWYGRYEGLGVVDDPKGPEQGKVRVVRGGSWNNTASNCRASCRRVNPSYTAANVGFRLTRTVCLPSR